MSSQTFPNPEHIRIDPAEHHYGDIYKLMIGAVVPRPIAFVSSIDKVGVRNLAPFSYFTLCGSRPPFVVFSPMNRGPHLPAKDTLRNVEETGEFVVNIVSESFLTQMNATAADYPPSFDEFEISGLTAVPSQRVKPARVGESLVQLECLLNQVVTLGDEPGSGSLVIGKVVLIHVNRRILVDPERSLFKIDGEKLQAVGRMGGPTYTRTQDLIHLERPHWPPKS